VVVGLAVAFLVVLVRPDLLPVAGPGRPAQPFSYADAVDISAPAVANVYTKRLVRDNRNSSARTRFRVSTNFASAVIIDPSGYLVTNYHVVAEAAEVRIQLSDGRIAEPETIGVDRETEQLLSSAFISSRAYGTRSSTLITLDRDNHVYFEERSYDNPTSGPCEPDEYCSNIYRFRLDF